MFFFRRKDNMMNVYDAMGVLYDSAELPVGDSLVREAMSVVGSVVIAYDELEPDWSNAPDDAKWYTIDANGAATWSEEEPFFSPVGKFPEKFWDMNGNYYIEREPVRLPLGIDWRLCKWQRPETTR